MQDENIARLKPDITEVGRNGLALSADGDEADAVAIAKPELGRCASDQRRVPHDHGFDHADIAATLVLRRLAPEMELTSSTMVLRVWGSPCRTRMSSASSVEDPEGDVAPVLLADDRNHGDIPFADGFQIATVFLTSGEVAGSTASNR